MFCQLVAYSAKIAPKNQLQEQPLKHGVKNMTAD